MTPPPDSNGNQRGSFLPPEFRGGTPWVFDMSEAQKNAHAEEMLANAEKKREEAAEIRSRNGWRIFFLHLTGFVLYGFVLLAGFVIGVIYWANR